MSRPPPGPVERSVNVRWLQHFVRARLGRKFSWTVPREWLAPADGGGGSRPVEVTPLSLATFRERRAAAEVAGTGQPVEVRYVDIPFEDMYTDDVVWCFVKPVAFSKHESYATAEIEARCLGAPHYFISHAWKGSFVFLVESVAACLEGAALDDTFVW